MQSSLPQLILWSLLLQLYSFIVVVVVAVVQSLSYVRLFKSPRTVPCQALLSSAISWSLLKFMSIELVILSNHLILCCPFSSCLQSFPATLLFKWASSAAGGQSIGTSASISVLPINPQVWFTLQLTGFIFLQFKGFSRVFSNTTLWKHQFFGTQPSLWFDSHIHTWLLEKTYL